MKCEEFMEKLDAYIDGELSSEDREAMSGHARVCDKCGVEMKNAEKLKDILIGIDDAVVPPLQAQAAWRAAVRSEGQIARMRRIYRIFGAAAAAFVLFIGCFAAFKLLPSNDSALPQSQPVTAETRSGERDFAFVAADGEEDELTALSEAGAEQSAEGMSASVKVMTDNLDTSANNVRSVVSEYNGYVGASSVSASTAYITAYIPSGSVNAFIDSLSFAGEVASSRIAGEGDGMASVTITIKAR